MSCTSEVPRPSSPAICRLDRFRPMKYRHNTQIRSGWWCPASTVPLRSSKRDAHAWQRYRCRCGCVSSCPFRTTASLPHPGQRTPSGQRCWRTKAKHFASSSRDARLTGSTVAMMTGPPCSPATADRLKPSSYLNPPPQASITPEADKSLTRYTCGEPLSFPVDLTGSVCTAGTLAVATQIHDVARNETNFAIISFAPGESQASFAGAAQHFISGDVLTITPRATDTALAQISGYLAGRG